MNKSALDKMCNEIDDIIKEDEKARKTIKKTMAWVILILLGLGALTFIFISAYLRGGLDYIMAIIYLFAGLGILVWAINIVTK